MGYETHNPLNQRSLPLSLSGFTDEQGGKPSWRIASGEGFKSGVAGATVPAFVTWALDLMKLASSLSSACFWVYVTPPPPGTLPPNVSDALPGVPP